MACLQTFGGIGFRFGDTSLQGAAGRPRALALLVLAAAAGEQGISRDKLVAFLWPDSDSTHARNSLKQTLFTLRQTLGADVFRATRQVLALDPTRISVDLCDFEAAELQGDLSRAAELYAGPFLDGFYLSGLPEFERWVDAHRAALAQRYQRILTQLAEEAEAAGDPATAVQWWQRLAADDPLNSHVAVQLIRALVANGDRAGALKHAETHEDLLRGELSARPDTGEWEYVRLLRSRAELSSEGAFPNGTGPSPSSNPSRVRRRPAKDETPSRAAPEMPRTAALRATEPARSRRSRLTQRWALGALLILLGTVAAGLVQRRWADGRNSASLPPGSETRVAMFPFGTAGGAKGGGLGRQVAGLLGAELDGVRGWRVLAPPAVLDSARLEIGRPFSRQEARRVARRIGAGWFVLGEIAQSNREVRISAALYQNDATVPPAEATVRGRASEAFELVDRLAAELIADAYAGDRAGLVRSAAITTRSLPALKAFLSGEEALRGRRHAPAIDAFRRAVSLDSTFAIAYYRLSLAADAMGQLDDARQAAEQAARYAWSLTEPDQRLVQAYVAWRRGELRRAEQSYRALAADYPDDVEAWLRLAELLFSTNPLRGRSCTAAREAFERVLALEPGDGEALAHLARIAWLEGRTAEVDTLVRRALAATDNLGLLELRATRAFALGDLAGQRRTVRDLLARRAPTARVTALRMALREDDVQGTARLAESLLDEAPAGEVTGYAHRLLALAALARGRWEQSRRELDAARPFDPTAALELQALFAALPFLPLKPAEIAAARRAVGRWPVEPAIAHGAMLVAVHDNLHPVIRLHYLGLLAARVRDQRTALRTAMQLGRLSRSPGQEGVARVFESSVLARLAAEGGRPAEALAELEDADWPSVAAVTAAEALDRFLRAELLVRVGREREALAWYSSIAERSAYELVYLAPAHRRQAEIWERLGDTAQAARHYAAFVDLWREADPSLQPMVVEARARLAALSPARLGPDTLSAPLSMAAPSGVRETATLTSWLVGRPRTDARRADTLFATGLR